MSAKRQTLGEAIDAIADRTGAAPEFVDRVRRLFEKKGISLDDDGARYTRPLEEAFARQAYLRRVVDDARQSLGKLQGSVAILNEALGTQNEKLKMLREGLERYRRIVDAHRSSMSRGTDKRSSLVRGDRDLPIVPGPEGSQ